MKELIAKIDEMIATQEHGLKHYGNIEQIALPAKKAIEMLEYAKDLIIAEQERMIRAARKNK